ncbi:MAG TPA: hypothetical protein ACHBZ9_16855 [Arsenophonus nasoniae]|uniref:hypothetical protein n=1 Tax=Arsenophonus nasoniae TaxID=638 RepID=UPI00387A32D0
MSTFFTLDRLGVLQAGMNINLIPIESNLSELQSHISELFGLNISHHGNFHFLNTQINLVRSNDSCSQIIEMLLEERRKAKYPYKPSRFKSMFACESTEDALWFCGKSGAPVCTPIFEISSSYFHRGDMNLLNMDCSPIELSHRLDLYWQGETKQLYHEYFPFWEIVIPLPACIGNSVSK